MALQAGSRIRGSGAVMTDIDLDALEATARAATSGPWEAGEVTTWGDDNDIPQAAVLVSGGPLTWDDHGGEVFDPVNAEHIAAFDPPTVLALIARLRTAENVVKDYDANFPCDGGCNVNDGPEETCSRHGRSPADLWNITEEQIKRANDAEARLREAEAVIAGALDVIRDRDGDPDGRIERILRAENVLSRYKTIKTEGNEP